MRRAAAGATVVRMDQWTRQELIGQPLVDRDGEHVGTVSEVFLDDVTGDPEWLRVSVGTLRERQSFVPLVGAQLLGASVRVPYTRLQIESAAEFGLEAHLSVDAVEMLRTHYDVATGITPPVEDLRERPGSV